MLHDLQPTEEVAACVGERLAVLPRDHVRELLGVLSDQRLKLQHHARAIRCRRGRPRGEGVLCGSDRRLHLSGRCKRRPCEHQLRRRVGYRNVLDSGTVHYGPVDEKRHARRH